MSKLFSQQVSLSAPKVWIWICLSNYKNISNNNKCRSHHFPGLNYKPKACQPQTSHVFNVNGRPLTDQEKQFIAMAINSPGTASGNTWYLEKYLKKIRTNYSIVGKRNVHDVHYHFLTNTEQPLVFLQYSGKEFYSKSLVCWQSLYFNSNALGLQKLCCKH